MMNYQEAITQIQQLLETPSSLPKSLWDEKEDVILAIKEAFMANRSGRSEHIVKSIDIEFCHEPECVEVDYNGR